MRIESKLVLRVLNMALRFGRVMLKGTHIGSGSSINCAIELGRGTWISNGFVAKGYGRIAFGKFCAVGADVKIITSNHDMSLPTMNFVLQDKIVGRHYPSDIAPVDIGHDVWIGDNVTILAGVNIGDGAVIGAGSILTRSVGAYEVHAGVPARLVGHRFEPPLVEALLETAWWDWSEDKMRANKAFFSSPVSLESLRTIR